MPSKPGDFHAESLTDPDLNLLDCVVRSQSNQVSLEFESARWKALSDGPADHLPGRSGNEDRNALFSAL